MRASLLLSILAISAGSSGASPRQRLAMLAKDYRIEILIADRSLSEPRRGYAIRCDAVREDVLDAYANVLETEWRRYPRSLIAKVGLRRIVVGTNVRVLNQPRAAVPDFEKNWFWLDAATANRIPRYGREVLHHDFFHLIDERDTPNGRSDPAWEALNPPYAKYGRGGWFMQTGNVGALREDLPGFLTEYATSAVEEDKAEVFGHLMTSPIFVRRRAETDSVLAAKVARIKSLLRTFDPTLDASWWSGAKPISSPHWR